MTKITSNDKIHMRLLLIFYVFWKLNLRIFGKCKNKNKFVFVQYFLKKYNSTITKKVERIIQNTTGKSYLYDLNGSSTDSIFNKIKARYSISRIGDGELYMLFHSKNCRVYFDRSTPTSRAHLLRVLNNPLENHILGLMKNKFIYEISPRENFLQKIHGLFNFSIRNKGKAYPFFSELKPELLEVYKNIAKKPNNLLIQADIFRNFWNSKECRDVWQNKDILYVIGSLKNICKHDTLDGFKKKYFLYAKSIEFLETYSKNILAYRYNEVLEKIQSYPNAKFKTIVLSQGMAATVLAYDLCKNGYHAIDYGQPDTINIKAIRDVAR